MPNEKTICAIIPTYKERGFLAAAVESIRSQLGERDSVLICANGCTDEYWTTVQSYAGGIVSAVRAPVVGISNARNYGLSQTSSDYVILLDDDDEVCPGAVRELRAALEADPSLLAVIGNIEIMSDAPGPPSEARKLETGDIAWDLLLGGTPTATMGGALFRRSALEAVGGMNEQFAPADDWDLWLKLGAAGRIGSIRMVTLRYRVHSSNVSGNVPLMVDKAMQVFRMHSHKKPLQPGVRSSALNRSRLWYNGRLRTQFAVALKSGDVATAFQCAKSALLLNTQYFWTRLADA